MEKPGTIFLQLAMLVMLLLLLVLKDWRSEGFWDTDAAVHALSGVYIMDLLSASPPPSEWMTFTQEYYARFPALGIVIYPPLVHAALVPFYKLFGISVMAARAVVFCFSALAVVMLYELIRSIAGSRAGFAGAFAFVTNLEIVRWSGEVMLELPAIFFILAAVRLWLAFLGGKSWAAYAAMLAVAAAVHSKQTAGFILVPLLTHAVHARGLAGWKHILGGLVLLGVLLAPLALLTILYGSYGTVQLNPAHYGVTPLSFEYWLHWAVSLPLAIHPAVLAAALAAGLLLPRAERKSVMIFVHWFVAWYLIFSCLPIKTIRFASFVVPAVAGFIAVASARWAGLRAMLLALLLLIPVYPAATRPAEYLEGYEDAARLAAGQNDGRPILFDGYYSADFIFEMRRFTGPDEAIVLRGSKMLTATASGQLVNYPLITSRDSFVEMLDKYAVEWIVVEDAVSKELELPHSRWLREILRADTAAFAQTAIYPIRSSLPVFAAKNILFYRYLHAKQAPADRTLEIYVPSAGMTVRVPIL